MRLAEQWQEIETRLPQGWKSARLSLSVSLDADPNRVALILASLAPGRVGPGFRFEARPDKSPGNILRRLDREGIRGRLDLMEAEAATPAEAVEAAPPPAQVTLARRWDEIVADLTPDWSEVYAELELDSSDFVPRGALLAAPLNPARYGGPAVLRFRCASHSGYGTAPEMARRCFERLDAERITGSLRVLRVLSDTSHAFTQGPVWRVGGRSV
ncbi:MAG TPA: hypothetical protein VH281_02815 [Gaiellaceae bacterium]